MDTHVRVLGVLNIIFGALSVCLFAVTLVYFGSFQELYEASQADFTVAAFAAFVAFHAIVGVPCIVLGHATMRYREWGRSLLTVLSALNVLNVPVGSVIGGYGLWVLLSEESEPLFAQPPPDTKRRKRSRKAPAAAADEDEKVPKVKSTSVLRSRGADAGPQ
jgi:hypothetical protein